MQKNVDVASYSEKVPPCAPGGFPQMCGTLCNSLYLPAANVALSHIGGICSPAGKQSQRSAGEKEIDPVQKKAENDLMERLEKIEELMQRLNSIQVPAELQTSLGWQLDRAREEAVGVQISRRLSKKYRIDPPLSDSCTTSRMIEEYSLCSDPLIVELDNFLTFQECDEVLRLCTGKFEPSKTSIGIQQSAKNTYATKTSASRTSYSCRLDANSSELVERLEHRVVQILKVDLAQLEGLCVLRYEPGQQFKLHHDGDFREYSMLLYLNDVEEGGETEFPALRFTVKPKKGMAIYWRNTKPDGVADQRLLHEAKPVIRGVKFSVPVFVNRETVR